MENHNCLSHLRSRERSPHERSSRDRNKKRKGHLKDNRPGNVQNRHHYPRVPHLLPREAERPPASQAEVLQAGIRLAEGNAIMPGVAPMAATIPPVSRVSKLPVTVSWIER